MLARWAAGLGAAVIAAALAACGRHCHLHATGGEREPGGV